MTAVVTGLALFAAACSGGGDTADPTADRGFENAPGEKQLQFTGAGKVRLGATLAVPPGGGPAPAVLIVPGPGLTSRDGRTVGAPLDNLYKDLSKAFVDQGMATFRYDRRGAGASTLEPGQQPTWEDMVTDAQEALEYLSERGEIDGSRLAVVGHDMGGPIALKLAANDARVKSVALVAAPGRPLVDVWADEFRALNGQESADAFRTLVADLQATGSFPPRDRMRAEHQTLLPIGQDALYKAMFAVDPLADAAAVKVPVMIALGERSTSVFHDDATRLTQALGGPSEVVVAPNSTATLQTLKAPPRLVPGGDPSDMSMMGGGPIIADAPREQGTVGRMASFLGSSLGARPA
ncbi:MAG TPA: alpha/beta fold hydrolase [Acidimicrobiales bacterium]|nr:alpha/beta fold hydrolase [Acidimicrobiales bacterium]